METYLFKQIEEELKERKRRTIETLVGPVEPAVNPNT